MLLFVNCQSLLQEKLWRDWTVTNWKEIFRPLWIFLIISDRSRTACVICEFISRPSFSWNSHRVNKFKIKDLGNAKRRRNPPCNYILVETFLYQRVQRPPLFFSLISLPCSGLYEMPLGDFEKKKRA